MLTTLARQVKVLAGAAGARDEVTPEEAT
jgi:hypothetical protein